MTSIQKGSPTNKLQSQMSLRNRSDGYDNAQHQQAVRAVLQDVLEGD